jgi:hypothetical protein
VGESTAGWRPPTHVRLAGSKAVYEGPNLRDTNGDLSTISDQNMFHRIGAFMPEGAGNLGRLHQPRQTGASPAPDIRFARAEFTTKPSSRWTHRRAGTTVSLNGETGGKNGGLCFGHRRIA